MHSKIQDYEPLDQSNEANTLTPVANATNIAGFSALDSAPSSNMEMNERDRENVLNNYGQTIADSKAQEKTAQIISKWQSCEQEIRRYRYMVIINWILIGWSVIGGIAGVIVTAFSAGILKSICNALTDLSRSFASAKFNSQETLTYIHENCVEFLNQIDIHLVIIGMMVVIAFHGLVIFCHYRGIQAYKMRDSGMISFVFLFYTIFLVLNMLMMNCFGMAAYGYLAYTANKLKAAFLEIKRVENFMILKGIAPTDEIIASTNQNY